MIERILFYLSLIFSLKFLYANEFSGSQDVGGLDSISSTLELFDPFSRDSAHLPSLVMALICLGVCLSSGLQGPVSVDIVSPPLLALFAT
jgi:hypothetical protein